MQQGSCNINSSSLSAGQFSDRPVQIISEIKNLHQFPQSFFKRFSCYSIKRCSVFQIFPDGKWLVQHTVLKYHAKHCSNFPSDLIQICALDLNRSAVFAKLPADDRNRCALPCPVYTKECKELSFFHLKTQIIDCFYITKAFL